MNKTDMQIPFRTM